MKIGILSDTHDNLPRLEQALEIFKQQGCQRVLHAGDFVSPFVLNLFKKAALPFTGVFGNNDGEWIFLLKAAEGIGEIKKGPVEISLAGRRIALMHEPTYIAALRESNYFDLVIFGHTHQPVLDLTRPLLINPGECSAYLSGKASAAICDLESLSASLIEL